MVNNSFIKIMKENWLGGVIALIFTRSIELIGSSTSGYGDYVQVGIFLFYIIGAYIQYFIKGMLK